MRPGAGRIKASFDQQALSGGENLAKNEKDVVYVQVQCDILHVNVTGLEPQSSMLVDG